MTILRIATALVLVLGSGSAAAQTAPAGHGSGLSLELGLVRHGQSDLSASPLRYTGSLPVVGLRYDRSGRSGRLEVEAGFAAGGLTSGITAGSYPREDAWLGRVAVRWLRPVGRVLDDRVTLLAGAGLSGHAAFRVHGYTAWQSENFADLLAPLELMGGWEVGTGRTGETRIDQRVAVPVAGLVMRTPYGGLKSVPPVEFARPGELTGFDHALSIARRAGGRLGLRATWTITVLRHTDPREIRLATHRVTVAGELRWGGER